VLIIARGHGSLAWSNGVGIPPSIITALRLLRRRRPATLTVLRVPYPFGHTLSSHFPAAGCDLDTESRPIAPPLREGEMAPINHNHDGLADIIASRRPLTEDDLVAFGV